MSTETRSPILAAAVCARSDTLIATTAPSTNGVTAVNFAIGATALPAFTGSTANEKYTVAFNSRTLDIELMVNVPASAVGATLDVYVDNNLKATIPASALGFVSAGVIKKTENVYFSLTSTAILAAASLAFTVSARQNLKFNDYFAKTILTPSPFTSQIQYDPSTLAPTFVYNNQIINFNSDGIFQLGYFSPALRNGSLTFVPTGSLAVSYPQTYFPTLAFTTGLSLAINITGTPNTSLTLTGNSTLAISIQNLNVPTFINLLIVPHAGFNLGTASFSTFSYTATPEIQAKTTEKFNEDKVIVYPYINRQISEELVKAPNVVDGAKVGFIHGNGIKLLPEIIEEEIKEKQDNKYIL
jgi:hypothetical protein